jgi:hypothetical protein
VKSPPLRSHIRFGVINRYGQCVPGRWIIMLFSEHDLLLLLVISRCRSMHQTEQRRRPAPSPMGMIYD